MSVTPSKHNEVSTCVNEPGNKSSTVAKQLLHHYQGLQYSGDSMSTIPDNMTSRQAVNMCGQTRQQRQDSSDSAPGLLCNCKVNYLD